MDRPDASDPPDDSRSDDPRNVPDPNRVASDLARPTSLEELQHAFARMLSDQEGIGALSPTVESASSKDDPNDRRPVGTSQAEEDRGTFDADDSDVGDPDDEFADLDLSSLRDHADSERASSVSPRSILEAILFVGHPENAPLTNRLMAAIMRGVTPDEIDQLVEDLNRQYDEQERPFRIDGYGDGYRLVLRSEFESLRRQLLGGIRHARLSQEAIDVLAIVAYRQPVDRDTIDQLRERSSQAILRQLVARELIQIEPDPEVARRRLYRTTDRFLDLLQLDSLADLPHSEDLEWRPT